VEAIAAPALSPSVDVCAGVVDWVVAGFGDPAAVLIDMARPEYVAPPTGSTGFRPGRAPDAGRSLAMLVSTMSIANC
jgi:hypothetical protein